MMKKLEIAEGRQDGVEGTLAAQESFVKGRIDSVLAQVSTFNHELNQELSVVRKQVTRADERVTQTNMEMRTFVAGQKSF